MGDDVKKCPNPTCQSDDVEPREYKLLDTWHYVLCGLCGMAGPRRSSMEGAVDEWNGFHRSPAPLAWSSERPKAAGVYWFRRREGAEPMIIKIDIREIESNWMWAERFQVAGPIPEPMEPPS